MYPDESSEDEGILPEDSDGEEDSEEAEEEARR